METIQNGNMGYMPVKDNKVLAIVSLVLSVLCCNLLSIIFAIIAVVKANDVSKLQMMGQIEMAMQSGRRAGLFSWIAIGLLIAGIIFQCVWFYAMGGMEMYQQMLQDMQ